MVATHPSNSPHTMRALCSLVCNPGAQNHLQPAEAGSFHPHDTHTQIAWKCPVADLTAYLRWLQAAVQNYFHTSRVAHNIKDLEKHLPSIASINGMQVKDYLQALSDESRLTVEKIGSGNWYWSFPSETRKLALRDLETARTAHASVEAGVVDLRARVAEAARAKLDGEGVEEGGGGEGVSREVLIERERVLKAEVAGLEREVKGYEGVDPEVVGGRRREVEALKAEVEVLTDDVGSLEGWFRASGAEREGLEAMLEGIYGDEWDEEVGGLREVGE